MRSILGITAIFLLLLAFARTDPAPVAALSWNATVHRPPTPEELAARWKETRAQVTRAREHELIANARAHVRSRLRDPASATFGQAIVSRTNLVCGYVNARNGFGGLTGLQPYIAGYRGGAVLMAEEARSNPEAFKKEWRKQCQ